MFPSFDFNLDTDTTDLDSSTKQSLGRVVMMDFSNTNNTATVKIVDGRPVEAVTLKDKVQIYVQMLLRTALDKYKVYNDTDFGMSYFNYLGMRELPKDFINSELQREITEKIKLLNVIEDVVNFSARVNDTTLKVNFSIILRDGTSENITEMVVI